MKKFDESLAMACRARFPGLRRQHSGRPAVFFDGPAGTQVPQSVADAMAHYLLHSNANHGGCFATSLETDRVAERGCQALADFIGAAKSEEIVFGPNMTTLTFAFSRALAREWKSGDEVVVSAVDHDANITPWVLAARDRGVTVKMAGFRADNCLLDLEHLRSLLGPRTRLVAVGCASNATGGIHPVQEIVRSAHAVGAEVFLDAVHLGPHGLIDVAGWGCDWLALSTYKFFGPHLAAVWGRSDRLAGLEAFKVRPSPMELPWKWMTGTVSFEAIAGAEACVEYLAGIGRNLLENPDAPRREAISAAMPAIQEYESQLAWQLIDGLQAIDGVRIHGVTDRRMAGQRVSTVSFTMEGVPTPQLAAILADAGIFVWGGNYYALEFTTRRGLEPDGMIRVGMLHYNLEEEVTRLLECLGEVRKRSLTGAVH